MRVVVIGATGNVGTSVMEALAGEPEVREIVAAARRAPHHTYPKASFVGADVTRSDLVPILRGADAVVHLAWLIQPSHDRETLRSGVGECAERVGDEPCVPDRGLGELRAGHIERPVGSDPRLPG